MLSKSEWMDIEERAAAAKRGERRAGWHAFKRWGSVPTAIGLVVLGVVLALRWIWIHAIRPIFTGGFDLSISAIPGGYWFVVGVAAVATAVAFRPRLIPSAFPLMRGVIAFLVWLGLIAYGVSLL